MHTPQKGTRSFHESCLPLKNNIFGKKDLRRLERLENALDNVEDTIEGLLQSMHVQYSVRLLQQQLKGVIAVKG